MQGDNPIFMTALEGHILTPRFIVAGGSTRWALLASVAGRPVTETAVRDSTCPSCSPGFVDLHVHGGGGADVMDGGDAALTLARTHVQHGGTTTLLATTMTAPADDLRHAFAGVATGRAAGGDVAVAHCRRIVEPGLLARVSLRSPTSPDRSRCRRLLPCMRRADPPHHRRPRG